MQAPTPLEQASKLATPRRYISLGIPTPHGAPENRFTLTPEVVGILSASGIEVRLEAGAGQVIHYDDARYVAAGARITERSTAFACDIVLYLSPLSPFEVKMMRRGALLLTLLNASSIEARTLEALVEHSVISLALDLVCDSVGHHPFADILKETEGLASITLAAAALADPASGKGILLGGLPGIVPCEVTVIGASIAGRAAARAAIGTGATVRIFDNDTYALREALTALPAPVIASVLNPHVLTSALRTADIVVVSTPVEITTDMVEAMKLGAIVYDLNSPRYRAFPMIPTIDLATADPSYAHPLTDRAGNPSRTCFVNPGAAVPRSCAMGVSNAFVAMMRDILTCDGINNAIRLNPGMQSAVFTFLGRLTNAKLARRCSLRYVDIHILVQLS